MKFCKVPNCDKPAKSRDAGKVPYYYDLCSTHHKRRERLGSPTARKCRSCCEVFDNDITAEIIKPGNWQCDQCLMNTMERQRWKPR